MSVSSFFRGFPADEFRENHAANYRAIALSASSAIMLVVLLAAAGCGGRYDASVNGIVKLNGTTVPRGTVTFTPDQSGPSGYGLIDDGGSYTIMTGREKGLPSGAYTVTVVANEASVANKNPSLPPAPGKPLTPEWYRNPAQSPLKYTVAAGSNKIDLELTSSPPAGWKASGR